MLSPKKISDSIANILLEIGSEKCIEKAKELQSIYSDQNKIHLRNLGLTKENVESITELLVQGKHVLKIKSISFSHNPQIGDGAAFSIAKILLPSVHEIGLVECGIKDKGGYEILNALHDLERLQMICIEQNHFSEKLKKEYRDFSKKHPHILVMA